MPSHFAVPMQQTFSTLAAFEGFAAAFAAQLQPGDVVALSGALGAGKTTFVRAAVRARHGGDQTSSPTFTFWHRYAALPGRPAPPIDHLDLYRVEDPAELTELGLDEVFDGTSIVFIEWWSHAPSLLPQHRYEVTIEGAGDAPRTVNVR
ncbi:MAG TPA: tRNA (adenosine(37)-N6)-threonylcarbamoyltransferase complex ATPase subunit type 1 TsaE [Candidatus Baltobacteraceae bacterium]|nr:tRNA (adenosine(37)-N6)-threonylcarbamoyltransferase complex ATPase subunit type 1 TsaE [Candidatus Baltobacteraceae bacterium]